MSEVYPIGASFLVKPDEIGEMAEGDLLYNPNEIKGQKLPRGTVTRLPVGVVGIQWDAALQTGVPIPDLLERYDFTPGSVIQVGTKVVWSTQHGHLTPTVVNGEEFFLFTLDDVDLIEVE